MSFSNPSSSKCSSIDRPGTPRPDVRASAMQKRPGLVCEPAHRVVGGRQYRALTGLRGERLRRCGAWSGGCAPAISQYAVAQYRRGHRQTIAPYAVAQYRSGHSSVRPRWVQRPKKEEEGRQKKLSER
eukprot:2508274-Rhodomonas_salina.2